MAQIQSLGRELPHAMGAAKKKPVAKKKKKESVVLNPPWLWDFLFLNKSAAIQKLRWDWEPLF